MSPLKVKFVVSSSREASARLRIGAALGPLASEGIEAECLELPSSARSRWGFIRSLAEGDVVVLHRILLNFLEFAFVRRNARRLVFDFDDAVMYRDPFRRSPISAKRRRRFSRAVAGAEACIAGNLYLKDLALECGAAGEVHLLPTPVDPGRYLPPPPPQGGSAVLGWIGQRATLPYLGDILPFLEGMTSSWPGLELRVISDDFPESPGDLVIDARPWAEETEAEHLSGIDVGLMPLRDDPWSRGKCGYKILQYFAAGKPVVSSPIGMNIDLVLPGKTGFLASTGRDWAEGIGSLLGDPELRRAMGGNGKTLLEAGNYTMGAYIPKLGGILRSIA